jgi:hypothetical protein
VLADETKCLIEFIEDHLKSTQSLSSLHLIFFVYLNNVKWCHIKENKVIASLLRKNNWMKNKQEKDIIFEKTTLL